MPDSRATGERAFIHDLRTQVERANRPPRASQRGSISGPASRALTLGIGDDCAILQPPAGHEILVTTDFTLETVHFHRDWHSPESVGHRCLARGLSDLAAMGAEPLAAFLSLALPVELTRSRRGQDSWRTRFFDGFLALADQYHVPLAGGDTALSPRISAASLGRAATGLALADIVLIGSAPRGRSLRRSTAKAGDGVYVSGFLGGAAAELAQLAAHPRHFRALRLSASSIAADGIEAANAHPHLLPKPRLAVGTWLRKHHRASSAIDISDGFSTDLHHICEESHLAATVDAGLLPMHPLAMAQTTELDMALHGGDDYELLFTASPHVHIPRRIAGVPITRIGEMRAARSGTPRVLLARQMNGRTVAEPLPSGGWEHSV